LATTQNNNNNESNPMNTTEYIITSKPGLNPYCSTNRKSIALKLAAKAQKAGFDGKIVEYQNGRRVFASSEERANFDSELAAACAKYRSR
jgi:hypothetical protein